MSEFLDANGLNTYHQAILQLFASKQGDGKNLLLNTLKTCTVNCLTCTVNSDKSITLTGTGLSETTSHFKIGDVSLAAGSYVLSGCAQSSLSAPYYLALCTSSGQTYNNITDSGSGNSFTLSAAFSGYVELVVAGGNTFSGDVFYPMIRESTASATYEPYIKTNLELTNDVISESQKTDLVVIVVYQEKVNNEYVYRYVDESLGIGTPPITGTLTDYVANLLANGKTPMLKVATGFTVSDIWPYRHGADSFTYCYFTMARRYSGGPYPYGNIRYEFTSTNYFVGNTGCRATVYYVGKDYDFGSSDRVDLVTIPSRIMMICGYEDILNNTWHWYDLQNGGIIGAANEIFNLYDYIDNFGPAGSGTPDGGSAYTPILKVYTGYLDPEFGGFPDFTNQYDWRPYYYLGYTYDVDGNYTQAYVFGTFYSYDNYDYHIGSLVPVGSIGLGYLTDDGDFHRMGDTLPVLPVVSSNEAGYILKVNSNGQWQAMPPT